MSFAPRVKDKQYAGLVLGLLIETIGDLGDEVKQLTEGEVVGIGRMAAISALAASAN